jgi:multicomponent Na+:H+ antiporter subunit C
MELLMPYVIGALYAIGIYLMLQRSLAQLIIGLAILTNAVNLLIFTVAGISRGASPIIGEDQTSLMGVFADPVAQALILTAIVIGFGVLAFGLVLVVRAYTQTGTDNLEEMQDIEA